MRNPMIATKQNSFIEVDPPVGTSQTFRAHIRTYGGCDPGDIPLVVPVYYSEDVHGLTKLGAPELVVTNGQWVYEYTYDNSEGIEVFAGYVCIGLPDGVLISEEPLAVPFE